MDEIITRYLRSEATKEEKQLLLDWLQENESNQKKFMEMRDVWLATGNNVHFDNDYTSKAFQRFIRNVELYEQNQSRQIISLPFWHIAAAIALLMVCVTGGYYIGKNQEKQGMANGPEYIINHVITQDNSKNPITLPDGTVAWLNKNSRLKYPQKFGNDARKVQLEGEGYFEVVRDEEHPFYVETSEMVVNVLGTRFDVKNYADSNTTETTLLSGKIEVFFPGTKERVLLRPNQKIQSDKQTGQHKLTEVNAANHIVWINDKLAFDNDKLSDIFSRMEHWYNIQIIYGKEIRADQRLSFTIRKESKEEIFKLISLIASITYRIDGDKVFIQSK